MADTSSSAKQLEGADTTSRKAEHTPLNSTDRYMIKEHMLAETKRDALHLIRASRKEKAVAADAFPAIHVVPRLDKGVFSASDFIQDTLVRGTDVEEYRRMVDGRVGSSSRTDAIVGIHTSQKSIDASGENLGDISHPSSPTTLHDEIHVVDILATPVSSNANVGLRWTKPAYKAPQESIDEKNNPVLRTLDLQLKLTEANFAALSLIRKQKKPVEEVAFHKPFAPLTAEEEEEVSVALNGPNRRELLVVHETSNIEITRDILRCLLPGAWLNDEVINLYFELLKEREIGNPKQFLRCHFFNTFFYKKLAGGMNGYDFKHVRRWTAYKKIGYSLIERDKIIVPVHRGIHWCLAVINVREKKFQYLDSLRGTDRKVLEVLARYLADEVKDKSGKVMDFSSWEREHVVDLPQQQNGWDCGMFMIKYADFYSRCMSLSFSQEHMPYFRKKTAKEILHLRAD